jgi:RNA polymerase sigma factor (sigma-70 family)
MAADPNEMLLIEEAKSGDDASFELLIQNCKTKAYNTALRFMKDEEDAMDALQESLVKVFRHLDQFKGECKFDTWVYRIVVNTCNDLLRKDNHLKKCDSLYRDDENGEHVKEIRDTSPSPDELLDSKETAEYVLTCLNRMKAEQREVIILRDIQGFTYEEISSILGCTIGTVKSRINRARLRLRDIVMEQSEEECV